MTKIKVLLILFLLSGIKMYSQSEYIIDKKGNKIIIDNGSSQMSSSNHSTNYSTFITITIYYEINGEEFNIDFSKVKEASFGNYKIQSYKINSKKALPYFIFCENKNYKLIGFWNNNVSSHHYIIDNDGKIIEDLSLKCFKYKGKEFKNRARVDLKIREYFGNCEELIRRLDRYKYNNSVITFKSKFLQKMRKPNEVSKNTNYENLNSFFYNPLFQKCQ